MLSNVQSEESPTARKEWLKIEGRNAFVIAPEKTTPQNPWVLYAPTLGRGLPGRAEDLMFRQFLDAGIAIAGIDVGESFGSPDGRKLYNAFYSYLTTERGFAAKASLLARSRGGLMLYCWAAENTDKVKCITGIYPVCNIASYPGLARACGAYQMTADELKAALVKHNPIDRLEPLAKSGIPIYHIHGDVDRVVPLEANSCEVEKRYKALGGNMELSVPKGQGHNMWPGFFQHQPLVDFLIKHATTDMKNDTKLPSPIAHWTLDDEDDTAVDSAGKNHGKIVGAVSADGRRGKARLFARKDGHHVVVPYSKDFELSVFTVSAWVKLTKPPTFSGILGTRFGKEMTFDMKVNAAKVHGDIGTGEAWIETAVNFYGDDTGTNGQGGKLKLNTWYLVTYVIDSDSGKCHLYLDADLKKVIPFEGKARLMQPGQELHIGHSSGTEYMDGIIDEVRIWDRALGGKDVKRLHEGE